MTAEKSAQKANREQQIDTSGLIIEEMHLRDITQTNMPTEPGFASELGPSHHMTPNGSNAIGINEFNLEFMSLEKFEHRS